MGVKYPTNVTIVVLWDSAVKAYREYHEECAGPSDVARGGAA